MPITTGQFETLERIVAVPSAYTQIDPAGDETAVQQLIWEMLEESSCCRRLSQQELPNQKRFNILAEKGAPIEEADFVVMVYVHTDTIKRKANWTSDYKLVRDGSMLRGIGAYDMKAGVMLLIDLLQTMDLPPGVTLVGAFCVGEERDSDGIETLMEWPHIKHVKLVLSPEIGTMGNDPAGNIRESDSPKDVIIGRPGNVKSNLLVTTGESHAFNVKAPDANDAWCCLRDHLKEQFEQRLNGQVRSHHDFGREFLRVRHVETDGDGEFESVAAKVRSKIVIRIVTPSTIDEIRTWQQRALERLMQSEQWDEQGICGEFTTYGQSYHPYIIRTDSPRAQCVFDAVKRHYGRVRFSVGQGVADGAYGHYHLNKSIQGPMTQTSIAEVSPALSCPPEYVPWIDIGPLGEGAHKNSERVYEESLVKLIEFYHALFRQYLPDYLASLP